MQENLQPNDSTAADEVAENTGTSAADAIHDKKDLPDNRYQEYSELKHDEFYEDIEDYRSEIEGMLEKYPGLGLTVKNAYDMLRGQKRAKELLEKKMILTSIRKTNAEERRQPAQASQTESPASERLDPTDVKALKRLQTMFPDDAWTAERYLAIMERNNFKI